MPVDPWKILGASQDGACSVVDGYTTNTTHVLKIIEKQGANNRYVDVYPLSQGILYFEFDIADGGTRHGQEIWLWGPRNNVDRPVDVYAISDWTRANGYGGMLGIENYVPSGAMLIDRMIPGQWYHVKLTVDFKNKAVSGEVDGTPMFSDYHPNPSGWSAITRLGFQIFPGADFGQGETYWDNLKLQMKCFAAVEPREIQTIDPTADPAPNPAHQVVYTVDNVGLDALTYTVEEVDAVGQPHEWSWLSLDKTGGSLASDEVHTVTATIAACPSAGRIGFLKFSYCGGLSEIRQISLLVPWPSGCNTPLADADADGDVDQADFAVLQQCYAGSGEPVPTTPAYCACLDFGDDNQDGKPDYDGDIDQSDVSAFNTCASGPGVPADPCCYGG